MKQEQWQARATKKQQEEQKMLQDMLQQVCHRACHSRHIQVEVCSSPIDSQNVSANHLLQMHILARPYLLVLLLSFTECLLSGILCLRAAGAGTGQGMPCRDSAARGAGSHGQGAELHVVCLLRCWAGAVKAEQDEGSDQGLGVKEPMSVVFCRCHMYCCGIP